MTTGETKFSILVSLFTWIQKTRTSAKKRTKFRKFLDAYCKPDDYFSAIRLILPSLDRERGSYGLKESVLATSLIDVLGMSRDSEDAVRLINWRKGGAKTGTNAGNFALVASEVLQRRQGMTSGGLTIKELNDLLDQLASSENRAEKTSVLSTMIKKTNAQEMKWIIMIILKDLKLGISEKSIFHEFHPDAEDLFNVTCDLKLVCEKLRDSTQRHKRQDIEVGKAVRPQLAMRVSDPAAAWKKLHGKDVLVECKFDGDRIQIHKNGAEIHYYSRNFLDHSEYAHGMSDIIMQNILVDRCILDGEMLVWDTSLNRFADFGSNQEIAKAAKDGLDSERQLCYVAFDILYVGDTSVIHQRLKERHDLLKNVVKPLKGRLDILVPNSGLNNHRLPGEPCWSRLAHSLDEVERFFKETIENRDEGIMLKDYDSKWEPSDRSGKWLKLKPDYIRAGSDLDVLIIGGYYGSGRHGGEVAQFLLGLAERPDPNTYPRRVGTGLTDEELDALVRKLKPYFRKYEYPKKAHPSFYQVTNNSKERPDVWIESPEKSVILSITSDIRTVNSEVFAAPYSLRFPRIDRVRYDKPWHECLDVQSFIELVHSSDGRTQKGTEYETMQGSKLKRKRPTRKGEKKTVSMVPSQFIQTDTSGIKGETLIFSNLMFYFVNVPATNSLDSLHKMVVENGGMFSMNLNSSVTHCIAAESKGIKYQAAKLRGDVIHFSWLLDCCSQKKLIPLQPKYFLFLSDSSKIQFQEEIDEYSDPYYWDVDLADLKQLLKDIKRSENAQTILYYKNKYCPKDKWSRFNECSIYFYLLAQSGKPDCEFMLRLALRRLELEVLMGGGKVSKDLKHATHLVVLSLPGANVDFSTLIKSFSGAEKRCIWKTEFHVVRSQWLEDCLKKEEKLLEDPYNLKPAGVEGSDSLECSQDLGLDDGGHDLPSVQNQNTSAILESPGTDEERESKADLENSKLLVLPEDGNGKRGRGRGRPAGKSTKRIKVGSNPTRRSQARRGKIPAKIYDEESDESRSNVKECEEEIDEGGNPVTVGMFGKDKERESVHRESSKSSVLPEDGNSKRGRGRPAGKSTKVGSNPIRRPQTRRGKVPAKINDEESDESGSDGKEREEQTDKEDRNSESVGTFGKENFGIDGTIVEDSESSPYRGKTIQEVEMPFKKIDEMGKGKDTEKVGMIQNMEMNRADFGQEEKKHDRLEVMVDPVQAMLLDMIPSLGMKREPEPEPSRAFVKEKKRPAVTSAGKNHEPEHSDSIVEDKKRPADSQVEDKKPQTSASASAELQALDENPPEEDIRRPSKKKKVSYKELAGELLKEYGRNT